MTLSRRSFSFAAAAGLAAAAVPRASRGAAAEPRFLLVVFVRGAWDVTWCLDPKRGPRCDVPAGDITSFAAGHKILTHADRPAIRTFFDAHAARAAVINGIWIGSVAHTSARIRILTGTRSARNPDVAALFAADAVKKNPALALPYVDLGGGAYAGPHASLLGRVGTTNQLVTLLDRARAFKDPAQRRSFDLDAGEQDALAAYVARRTEAMRRGAVGPTADRLDGFRASLDRAAALRGNAELRAMSVGRATSLAQQGELAIALLRSGVAAAAFLDSRLDWDTHDAIADQGVHHERLFTDLTAIAARLEQTGMLERTTVAVLSEFTRTPRLNKQPDPGKDHWPLTSALVFGGGVGPGRFGTTDDGLGAVRVRMDDGTASDSGRLLQFDNFAAGLLGHLGVPHSPWIPNVEPFRGPFA